MIGTKCTTRDKRRKSPTERRRRRESPTPATPASKQHLVLSGLPKLFPAGCRGFFLLGSSEGCAILRPLSPQSFPKNARAHDHSCPSFCAGWHLRPYTATLPNTTHAVPVSGAAPRSRPADPLPPPPAAAAAAPDEPPAPGGVASSIMSSSSATPCWKCQQDCHVVVTSRRTINASRLG